MTSYPERRGDVKLAILLLLLAVVGPRRINAFSLLQQDQKKTIIHRFGINFVIAAPEFRPLQASQDSSSSISSPASVDNSWLTNDEATVSPPLSMYSPLHRAIAETTAVLDKHDASRIFHGRGGVFEGCEHVTLDWFPPVWLLTSHHVEIPAKDLAQIQQSLEERFRLSDDETDHDNKNTIINLVYQHRSVNSTATTQLLSGSVPDPHVVEENGMKFSIRLLQGQNQGIFLDMKNGREWVRQNAKGRNVLNLFAYTCGFSIAALMGNATEVINMDMARGCLKVGQRNHELNEFPEDSGSARFFAHDIFKSWGKIRRLGTYGLIVVDPPSFQKGSFVAKKDYQKILRRLPELLLEPTGLVMLCLNAPELDSAWLQDEVAKAAPELEFVERIANPSSFPAKDSDRSLKIFIYKLQRG